MKNVIFGLLVLFFFSCTEEELVVNKPQNYSTKEKIVLNKDSYSVFLKNRKVSPYLKKGGASNCGLEIMDIMGGSSCQQDFVRTGISAFGTSLEGLCNSIPVTYVRSFCLSGDKVDNIVIADVEIDYDDLVNSCPGLTLPTDQGDLESFLIELEREVAEIIEFDEVNVIFSEYNGDCNFLETPTVVTRVATTCFQYCFLQPQNPGESWTLKKNLCGGDICCYKRSKYCEEEGEIVKILDGQWSTGDFCEGSVQCDGLTTTENCEHDCILTQ